MASILPGLRRAAPRLSRHFFICHQCMRRPDLITRATRPNGSPKFTTSSRIASTTTSGAPTLTSISQSIEAQHALRLADAQAPPKEGFAPKLSSKSVAYWLLASAASVYGLVVFGGLTRLTESGLSITEWKPVTGSIWPSSPEAWQAEFDRYRASPEFKQLNSHMNIDEFKKIYFMEWAHRQWGRFVGLSFVIPSIYFVARRKVSAPMAVRLFGISALIGFQGFIGWWMVKSGLKDDLFAPGAHPRVSQYRLTAHLGTAFICYTAMLWNGLSILREHRLVQKPGKGLAVLSQLASPQLSVFRKSIAGLFVLVFVTAMSGGLLAGLDAGLIYNEFPYMGNGLTPPKSELFDKFYSHREDQSDLWWRNMLENPSTVQLNHRILACTTFTTIIALFAYSRLSPRVAKTLTKSARKGMLGVVHLVSLQVALGISTLIYLVPTHLAAAHQAGSLALLTGVAVLGSRIWMPPKRTMKLLNSLKQQASYKVQHMGDMPVQRATQKAAKKGEQ